MAKKCIATDGAPQAIGPYSQANVAIGAGLVFCSGQIAIDPGSGKLIDGDIAAQTERVLRNLQAVLEAAGSGLEHVVKTTVFLSDLNDFQAMNAVYERFFPKDPPARATVQAAKLPLDVALEIDAIAVVD